MRYFFDEQGRTRVFVPRIAGQEGVHGVRRKRKPAENIAHREKSHLVNGNYTRPPLHLNLALRTSI